MASGNTALIIDDDPTYREVMGELLRQNGWRVLLAENGEQGIEIAQKSLPDVVLCDLLMPRGNGFQVCRQLREDVSLRHTRIIVTSARDFISDRQAAFEAGANEYLTKPVDPNRLLHRMEGFSRKAAAGIGEVGESAAARGPAQLRFWGVRGSIATPGPGTIRYGGNTTCLEVRADGQIIILDAGTGLRLLGLDLEREFGETPLDLTILLTHTHWDHIQGLPFFLPVYRKQNKLRILGYEGARHGLDKVLTSQMESPFFPVGLREVPANVQIEELRDLEFQVGPVPVRACFANHPGITMGYRLYTSAGSIAFFPDNEPHCSPVGDTFEFEPSRDSQIVEFVRGSDILVMDTQYDCTEYRGHIGWGHGCLDVVVSLALTAGVKQLFLFHHDPNHDDAKVSAMVVHAESLVRTCGGKLQVAAATEGLQVELPLKTVAAQVPA